MIRGQLKLYCGPDASDTTTEASDECFSRPSVPMTIGEFTSVLSDALQQRRAWLEDFRDEEVLLSPDLFEVLLAYQHYHRPSA